MATLLEHLAARIGLVHARRVFARFERAVQRVDAEQQQALRRTLTVTAQSDFGRRHGLDRVRTLADLRRALPLATYEDYRPYIDRVCDGDLHALLAPGQQVLMFATSSGTTAKPKLIPVTPTFIADYRRGWNTFGLKMLTDHPRAVLRAILQSSSRWDAGRTRSGIPCGAITGLLARSQKRIVRQFYVGRPQVAHLPDPAQRYYTLMRLGVVRDVAFAITANPATLLQMARTADEQSETLIRDVRDGTLSPAVVNDDRLRRTLSSGLKPDPVRAAQLDRLRRAHGMLRPRDYWQLEFLACWTGGSMGHYLQRLADWWGTVPVRDVGLLASEGRVSLPLSDGTPAGVLDVTAAAFEFIPAAETASARPQTLAPRELDLGRDYAVVLTNATGLLRYRLDDVVRVRGWYGQAPLLEFLYRAGRVASVAGEKLTENQAVAAVQSACRTLDSPDFDFALAPVWGDPPFYRLTCSWAPPDGLVRAIDDALAEQNEEYASRRKSNRLGPLAVRRIAPHLIPEMDRRLTRARRGTPEQYKRPCLFTDPGEDDRALGLRPDGWPASTATHRPAQDDRARPDGKPSLPRFS